MGFLARLEASRRFDLISCEEMTYALARPVRCTKLNLLVSLPSAHLPLLLSFRRNMLYLLRALFDLQAVSALLLAISLEASAAKLLTVRLAFSGLCLAVSWGACQTAQWGHKRGRSAIEGCVSDSVFVGLSAIAHHPSLLATQR